MDVGCIEINYFWCFLNNTFRVRHSSNVGFHDGTCSMFRSSSSKSNLGGISTVPYLKEENGKFRDFLKGGNTFQVKARTLTYSYSENFVISTDVFAVNGIALGCLLFYFPSVRVDYTPGFIE